MAGYVYLVLAFAGGLCLGVALMLVGQKTQGVAAQEEAQKLPSLIADPDGGPAWKKIEGDYYDRPSETPGQPYEMRYADLIAYIEHAKYRGDMKAAKASGAKLGHTEDDGCENYDLPYLHGAIQLRHRCRNGHDAPGPWDRCEWPASDMFRH